MRQYWVAPIPPFHVADGAAVTATATLTDGSPAPPIVLPANLLEAGSRISVNAGGRYTTTGTQGTITVGIYYGTGAITSGMAIATTGAVTWVASQTNRTWRLEGEIICRAVGSGSSGSLFGIFDVSNLTSGAKDMAPATTPTALACDTTVANKLMIGFTNSAASQSITCHYLSAWLVN